MPRKPHQRALGPHLKPVTLTSEKCVWGGGLSPFGSLLRSSLVGFLQVGGAFSFAHCPKPPRPSKTSIGTALSAQKPTVANATGA
jgi:hypothetical protein